MKDKEKTVQKYGCVVFENLIYSAGFKRDKEGYLEKYDKNIDFLAGHNGKVIVRYAPSNIVRVLAYTIEEDDRPSKYLGVLPSRDLTESRLSLREWKEREKQIRKEGKAIDQTSILAQQRDLNKFADEKVKELRRKSRGNGKKTTIQKRRDEHQRIVEQTPGRNELGKALSAFEGANETEGVDRLIAEVEARDASTILPIDTEIISVPLQAEVERIGAIDPYVAVGRDKDLFVCLNNWRDRRTCGRIMTVDSASGGYANDWVCLKLWTIIRTNRRDGAGI